MAEIGGSGRWLKYGILLSILSCYIQQNSKAIVLHNMTSGQRLGVSDTLESEGGFYRLGFFDPATNSKNLYLGIWFTKAKTKAVVWVSNREQPFTSTSPVLIFQEDGNLVALDGNTSYNVTNATEHGKHTRVVLLDSGNLVMEGKKSKVLWESFDYPSDTLLPGMRLGYNKTIGKSWAAISWKSLTEPSLGPFRLMLDPSASGWSAVVRHIRGRDYAYATYWLGDKMNSTWSMNVANYTVRFNYFMPSKDYAAFTISQLNETGFFIRYKVLNNAQVRVLIWTEGYSDWVQLFSLPNRECDFYGFCGKFSVCDQDNSAIPCTCLPGFNPVSPENWENENYSDGCEPEKKIMCGNSSSSGGDTVYQFVEQTGVTLPALSNVLFGFKSQEECRSACRGNCSCHGYSFKNSRCSIFDTDISNVQRLPTGDQSNGESIFFKVAVSDSNPEDDSQQFVLTGWKLWLTVVTTLSAAIISSSLFLYQLYKEKLAYEEGKDLLSYNFHEKTPEESSSGEEDGKGTIARYQIPLFKFTSVCSATDDFSAINKLGKGGFGAVYKGTLQSGEEIIVKRLSKLAPGKGSKEIRNEALLIAELQHDNLVRLLGCCLEANENIIIYEYFAHGSLDYFLFDPTATKKLDWENRTRIIDGIATGLNYLHEYSRLQIIHGDLKATNILLDENMNPKISDFAMTRIFGANETLATNRVAGTFGYMSPEYVSKGFVSNKSDVFSFGVLVLEILTGKKNNYRNASSLNLMGYVWDLWKCGRPLDLIDPSIGEYSSNIETYIEIALLCVQENDNDRPTMSDVISYLRNEVMDIPTPKEPAFTKARTLV